MKAKSVIFVLASMLAGFFTQDSAVAAQHRKPDENNCLSAGAQIINNPCAQKCNVQFKPPKWFTDKNNVLYEMQIQRTPSLSGTVPDGTFKAATEQLYRLADLGITIIWVMPVYDNSGEFNKIATINSLYATTDFYKLSNVVGNLHDAKNFVKTAHKLGIKVLFDAPTSQTSWNNQWMNTHPEYYLRNSNGENYNYGADSLGGFIFDDISGLNTQLPAVQKEMSKFLTYWVKTLDIDGYRLDIGRRAWPPKFWERARYKMEKIKPVFLLTESNTNSPASDTTSISSRLFDANMGAWMEDTLLNSRTSTNILRQLSFELLNFPIGFSTVHYTSTSDTDGAGTPPELWGDFYYNSIILNNTMLGLPMIKEGEDFNNPGIGGGNGIAGFSYTPLPNSGYDVGSSAFIKKVLQLRKDNSALHNVMQKDGQTFFQFDQATPNDSVYGFVRYNSKNRVIVLVNLTDEDQEYSFVSTSYNTGFGYGILQEALAPGKYANYFYDPSQPISPANDPYLIVNDPPYLFDLTGPTPTLPIFTTLVPANGFKVYTGFHEFHIPGPVDIDAFYDRWEYYGAITPYQSLPKLLRTEGAYPGYISALTPSTLTSALNAGYTTFFVPVGNAIIPGFNINDFIVQGKVNSVTTGFGWFISGNGNTFNALSGNPIIENIPVGFGPPPTLQDNPPQYTIGGNVFNVVATNRSFVYDSDKQGIVHFIELAP